MKQLKITPPEGYEIDKERSTFENIVFKELKKELPKSWEELGNIEGYYVDIYSDVCLIGKCECDSGMKNVFLTKEQAEASIALAQLSQLRNVYRNGWIPIYTNGFKPKYVISFFSEGINKDMYDCYNSFLSFQDEKTRDLFLENFRDLIEKAKPLMS